MTPSGLTTSAVALDTEFANRKIWLVKVPKFVAEHWKTVCAESAQETGDPVGPQLGQITWEGAAPSSSAGGPQMQLTLTHPSTANLPKSYAMSVATNSMAPMIGFAQAGPRSVAVVGKVAQKFDIEVGRTAGGVAGSEGGDVIDPEYRALSRLRAKAAASKTRTTQLISQPQITDLRQPVYIGSKKKDPSEKRLAKPTEELTADLFRLFERQAHWSFSQLQRQTDQPTQHLKVVLMEIAVQNKRGPYKDLWELKKGYRLSGGEG